MGIIRELIGNVASAKMQEHKQRAEQQAQLTDLLTTMIRDPLVKPEKRALAEAHLLNIVTKHGGKQGRELAPQLAGTLSAWNSMQNLSGQQPAQAGGAQAQIGGVPEGAFWLPQA